ATQLEDAVLVSKYEGVISAIKEADPEDSTGFVARLDSAARYGEFEETLSSFAKEGNTEGALDYVNETIESGGFQGDSLQQIMMVKAMISSRLGDSESAASAIDEAIAINPESRIGKRLKGIKTQLQRMEEQKQKDGE
ncbi:MAG: hypothetical protein ACQKBU_11260, partial [Verrucomicrobiales bacterium]